jgi:hypothetical protein
MSDQWYKVETTGKTGTITLWARNPDDAAHKAFQTEMLIAARTLKKEFGTINSALKTDKCMAIVHDSFRVTSISLIPIPCD